MKHYTFHSMLLVFGRKWDEFDTLSYSFVQGTRQGTHQDKSLDSRVILIILNECRCVISSAAFCGVFSVSFCVFVKKKIPFIFHCHVPHLPSLAPCLLSSMQFWILMLHANKIWQQKGIPNVFLFLFSTVQCSGSPSLRSVKSFHKATFTYNKIYRSVYISAFIPTSNIQQLNAMKNE